MAREREKYINSINLNSQTDFPYLVLDVVNDRSYPRNPGFHVMHWHEDLQFGYVLEGAVVLETLDESWKSARGRDSSSIERHPHRPPTWKLSLQKLHLSNLFPWLL